jgi:heme/copper-type cytochrome/quinol oxidase subunit 2
MTAKVIVVEPERYQQWLEDQKSGIDDARKQVQEQRDEFQASEGSGTGSG